jgi:DNA-binding GntR family transcriptional regulator
MAGDETNAYHMRVATLAVPERSQLRDAAAAHIRELIVAGLARPGELLRLAPLAERIGASITPVREALLLLAQDGWVLQEPNRGFRVSVMRRNDVEDAYFVHGYVAGELARRAALRADAGNIEELRRLDATICALPPGEEVQSELLNYELHDELYAIAESPRLVLFVTAASRFVPRRYWATISGWSEINRLDHAPIIDAVASGNADLANELMTKHIQSACGLLLTHLDSVGFWANAGEND